MARSKLEADSNSGLARAARNGKSVAGWGPVPDQRLPHERGSKTSSDARGRVCFSFLCYTIISLYYVYIYIELFFLVIIELSNIVIIVLLYSLCIHRIILTHDRAHARGLELRGEKACGVKLSQAEPLTLAHTWMLKVLKVHYMVLWTWLLFSIIYGIIMDNPSHWRTHIFQDS